MKRLSQSVVVMALGIVLTCTYALCACRTAPKRPADLVHHPQEAVTISQDSAQDLPPGWKRIHIQNKVTLYIPSSMKDTEPIGDSDTDRLAYEDSTMNLTIAYEPDGDCVIPDYIRSRKGYEETHIEIDGRTVSIGIDRSFEPKFTTARACIPKPGSVEVPLRIVAVCKNAATLSRALQIFATIKFK